MIWIIFCVIGVTLLILIGDLIIIGFPKYSKRKRDYEKGYLLKEPNRMDIQQTTECSGFSLAHVLRSFGIETDGKDVYENIKRKMKNGAVMPRTLTKVIRSYGLHADYVKGSLETLKADISEGKRIIGFVKTQPDKKWLHYISIVGYDEENIFIAESLKYLVNCDETFYNRKLTITEFLRLWDTRECYMPFYRNTYVVISKEQ